MTSTDLTTGGQVSRLGHITRDWWPIPAFIAGALLAQQLLLTSRYDVGGHAAEHLAGATAPFMAAALLSVLFWASPAARRHVDLIAVGAVWLATTVLVMLGNLRVVDDLVTAGYSRTPTGSVPDVADHSLANSSVWYAEAAALVLVAAWRRRRHIGNRATLGAVVITVVIPPWIIPGAGVIVLAIVRIVQRHRATEVVSATVCPATEEARVRRKAGQGLERFPTRCSTKPSWARLLAGRAPGVDVVRAVAEPVDGPEVREDLV